MALVLVEVRDLGEQAAKLAAASLWPLPDDELTDLLRAAHRLGQAAEVLQARIVQQAAGRGLPAARGYRSTTGWVRSVLLLDSPPAREIAATATALSRSPALEQALLDGRLDARQATAIAATIEALPGELAACDDPGAADTSTITAQAEATMIHMAARLSPYQLRRVGERILAHVAPQVADRLDEAILARQEARAHLRRGITLSLPVNGMVRVTGALSAEDAAIVHAALHPLCQPAAAHDGRAVPRGGAVPHGEGPVPRDGRFIAQGGGAVPRGRGAVPHGEGPVPRDSRTPAQRRADALVDVCRLALRTGELPTDGGEPPQLAVTVAYDPLTRALGGAVTDTGHRLSAAAVRRLACDARILPVVLGGDSQILDAGRSRRLVTGVLRRALAVRDRGCTFPDCERPPRWTDAHHVIPWAAGGRSSLGNTALVCRPHHRLLHEPTGGWRIRMGADERPEFIPPPWIDPQQRPRRNLYHHRQ